MVLGGPRDLDPATGEVVGRAPVRFVEDLDAAVARARAAQQAWVPAPIKTASTCCCVRRTRSRRLPEPLAERLSREQGKPVNGPNARFEVGACAAWAPATAATQLPVETVVDDAETHTELRYRPVGVVDAIGPWNWPMMITVCQVAPSLRMGNTVVVKPTEYTSLRLGGERGLGRRAAATFSTDGNETVSSSSRNLHHHLASAQLLPQR